MAGDEARVRVNWTRRVLAELERRMPDRYGPVLERMGPSHVRAIREAGLLSWLPCAHHLALCEALRHELGDWGLTEHFAYATLAAGELPLFRPIADASVRLFGLSPASIVRAGPQAWNSIFRNMGSFTNDLGDASRSVTSVARVTAPVMRRDDTFALGLEGGLWACLWFANRDQGTVEADRTRYRSTGEVVFVTRW